jgi:hypothetical protein
MFADAYATLGISCPVCPSIMHKPSRTHLQRSTRFHRPRSQSTKSGERGVHKRADDLQVRGSTMVTTKAKDVKGRREWTDHVGTWNKEIGYGG